MFSHFRAFFFHHAAIFPHFQQHPKHIQERTANYYKWYYHIQLLLSTIFASPWEKRKICVNLNDNCQDDDERRREKRLFLEMWERAAGKKKEVGWILDIALGEDLVFLFVCMHVNGSSPYMGMDVRVCMYAFAISESPQWPRLFALPYVHLFVCVRIAS